MVGYVIVVAAPTIGMIGGLVVFFARIDVLMN